MSTHVQVSGGQSLHQGATGPWQQVVPKDATGPGLATRDVDFGQAAVVLAGDIQV